MRNDYLLDKDFLKKVDNYYQREVYAKVISLDFNENSIAEITGNVTQGTINVNGDSAVRRTCNLTLVTSSIQVNEVDWSLHTKFKLLIGLKNFVDDKYDDILWFKQGTYVITSFNSQLNQSGYTISIQGKDKMCLLNGDIGGNLFAAHDFGKIETKHDDGTSTLDNIPIYDIIREALHVYALEPYSNIVINDLEGCAVELLDFKAKGTTLYIVSRKVYPPNSNDKSTYTLTSNMYFSSSELGQYLEEMNPPPIDGQQFSFNGEDWILDKKVFYGDTVGYRLTELTYVGDLIISAGGTIVQVLDNIVKMLGEFEYFYDIDGKFIFQRKRIHYNIPWTSVVTNEDESYYETAANTSSSVYEFNRGLLVESFQNKPAINNIKNDFSVWGKMQGSTREIPIHLRYAIDVKPKIYYSYSKKKLYISREYGGQYDWRELLYQMAVDNNIYRGDLQDLANEIKDQGITAINQNENNVIKNVKEAEEDYLNTWNTGYDAYYADMLGFWRYLYSTDGQKFDPVSGLLVDMNQEENNAWIANNYWNPLYVQWNEGQGASFIAPQILPFWIDFIDILSDLGEYSVGTIGRRSKVINDADVKAIFFRDTPDVLFIDPNKDIIIEDTNLSYIRFTIPPVFSNYFTISSQGKSAKETLDNLVYQHTYYQESISMSTIPIYYLEPNTRITVEDEQSGISGEYLIKSFNLSLAHDGMMSITASKAANRIL